MKERFKVHSSFEPAGDQPAAITELVDGIESGLAAQTLLGVTGSGKTFTVANVIAQVQRPTIIMAHNKTLAAQLYGEFKEFFPDNAVEYFVSYYDYYQPEAYVPSSDTFIEKDASINDHIEQMRLSATKALLEREDAIIVATVSAIYGLGDPKSYLGMMLHIDRGDIIDQRAVLRRLAELQYTRNDVELHRGTYRVRGDVIDIFPAESEKEAIRIGLQEGSIKVVIGTHALLEDPVQFADLELAVIDEQHRFGVDQRAMLRTKGKTPHLMVMTATPIPRSLALTLYGDLDLSIMDEMPAGRQPVDTYILTPQERERAYTLIRTQIKAGRQVFIIYPLIEESDKIEARAAVDDHETLSKEIFPDMKVGLLHGRMRPDEKDATMLKFRDKEFDILVSTTVVEVGVDVPNATVMLIEGANRFGLAQLHQLRGRVGRGSEQSYCLLIPDHEDAVENERLQAMVESNDGFVLAERDLQQRGPGEFLGTRQSGYATGLRMASLTDVSLIEDARSHAQKLFDTDAKLEKPEHALLSEALERFWGEGAGDVS